jgi:hypothetical protein
MKGKGINLAGFAPYPSKIFYSTPFVLFRKKNGAVGFLRASSGGTACGCPR